MEWEAIGIVLASTPFGEADAVTTVLTDEHGVHRGLVRGARSRRSGSAAWETGDVLRVRWVGRLAEQLGTFSGEILRAPASMLLDAPRDLAALASACAVAAGALAERQPCHATFQELLHLLGGLAGRRRGVAELVRWEATLLRELGFGLDLTTCAVSGRTSDLSFVSPRTGRAVSEACAGAWRERLLPLPRFMLDQSSDLEIIDAELHQGLVLTGHFLARDAFGQRHQGLPAARDRLLAMVDRAARCGEHREVAG